VLDTWGGLMHCPTPCDFDTACVHKSLIYLPVVQISKEKAANHFFTLYSKLRASFKRFPRFTTSLDASLCLVILCRLLPNRLRGEDYISRVSYSYYVIIWTVLLVCSGRTFL